MKKRSFTYGPPRATWTAADSMLVPPACGRLMRLLLAITVALWGFSSSLTRADVLYVGCQGAILKFDSAGASSYLIGQGVRRMGGMAFDRASNLYVATEWNNSVHKVTPSGHQSDFAHPDYPMDVAFDRAGNLYAAEYYVNAIIRYTPSGVPSIFATANSGLNGPLGLAFDREGSLYVSNGGNNTITRLTPDGVGSVFASGEMAEPHGLAFDSLGSLYVACYQDRVIRKITSDGVSSVFARSLTDSPQFLAFDRAGNLYVSNFFGNTIVECAPEGAERVFARINGASGLAPSGLAFTDDAGVPLPLPIPEPAPIGLFIASGYALIGHRWPRTRSAELGGIMPVR